MSEPEQEVEFEEPQVTDVPEPDQDAADEEAEAEASETQDTEPEPDETPEAHGPTQEEMEKRFTVVERRFKTYTDAVTKIWEEDALHLIPFNLDPAAPPGFIDGRNKGRVDDETKQAALLFLGFDGEASMEDDPYSEVCATCKGWGMVKTGSRVPNQDTRQCLDCRGVGYIPTNAVPASAGQNGVSVESKESGQLMPAATGVESPEVESLRLRGYTIIPPMTTGTP